MKQIFSTALLTLLVLLIHAQYTVTKVNGRIKNSNGRYLKPGSSVGKTDTLVFSSAKDKLWVIMQGAGEKTIAPSQQAAAVPGGLQQSVAEAVITDALAVSSRGGMSLNEKLPDAIRTESESTGKIVIEEENKFLFDPAVYPQNGRGEFFLQINVPSKNQNIRRKLRVNNDTLIIYYEDFLTEVNNKYNQYLLGYHQTNSTISTQVTEIKPHFDLTDEMNGIIANTVSTYKKDNMPKDSLLIKTYNNVYRMSGKPNGILFMMLFDKYWQGTGTDSILIKSKGKGNKDDDTGVSNIPILSTLINTTRDELPDNFSLRQYAPPVGDQGEYSTCAAWSTAYAGRTIAFAVSHNYTYLEDSEKINANTFSPDFVYNNLVRGGQCDDGLNLHLALKFIRDSGTLVKRNQLFKCSETYMQSDAEKAKGFRIKDFAEIETRKGTENDVIGKIKAVLVNRHPVIFGMYLPTSFDSVDHSGQWQPNISDYTEIDSLNNKQKKRTYLNGHAMCITGYNDSVAGGSFEIMNSWGQSRARKGFYWINYDDFYRFVQRVYTISDFLPDDVQPSAQTIVKKNDLSSNTISSNTVRPDTAKLITLVTPPSLNVLPPATNTTIAADTSGKPRLSGALQFMYVNRDDNLEPIGFNTNYASTKWANSDSAANKSQYKYSYYSFTRPLHLQDQYNIKLNITQDAYVYIMGANAKDPYYLFPRIDSNESPLVNVTNATLTLPNDHEFFSIDNKHGTEQMCVLLSKSPINTSAIYRQFSAGTGKVYDEVLTKLANRLPLGNVFKNDGGNRIDFDCAADDNTVLALFIEINHL